MITRNLTLGAWVRATSLGWALGLVLLILLVLAGEAVGLGSAQTPVGLGIGAGVGFVQSRALRGLLNARSWMIASAAGHLIPFLSYDLAQAAGLSVPFSLYICVGLSGVITGFLQWRLLRPCFLRAGWWLPAAMVGWSLAAATVALGDQTLRVLPLRGVAGAGLYLTMALSGGLVLGIVTGLVIARLPQRPTAAVHAAGRGA